MRVTLNSKAVRNLWPYGFRIEFEFGVLLFLWREKKPKNPKKNPRTRVENQRQKKTDPQLTPAPEIESGPGDSAGSKVSVLITAPSLHPLFSIVLIISFF